MSSDNANRVGEVWGDSAPDWIITLADMCDRTSQNKAATAMGYSHAVINQVLKNTYKGDLKAVQKAVEGAFLNATVECPVMFTIPAQKCIAEQRKPLRPVNTMRIRLHKACRNGCPHFRGKAGD